MKRKLLWITLIVIVSVSCSLFGGDKETETKEPAAQVEESKEDIKVTTSHSPKPAQPSAAEPEQEVEEEKEEAAPAPKPQANVNPNAPKFFKDELDGPLTDDWSTVEYFVTDDDDEEATPIYTVEQERGARKFYLESPYLYVYQFYEPHQYQDVRIDFEVENKAVNTNNVGIVCRSTDYGWYEFITTSGGYYSIMRYYEDGDKELASGGIKSIRFGVEKKNVYTAICEDKYLTLIVNDVEIARVKDEEIVDPGYAGINVSSEAYTPVQLEMNWLAISEP